MGKVVKAVVGIALVAVSFGALGPIASSVIASALFTAGTALVATALMPALPVPETQLNRLNIRLDPSAPRKGVLGTTAMALDLRYHEGSGDNQEYIDYIICVAAHKVQSITDIYFEQEKAWNSTTGVESTYDGYLTVATVLEGTDSNYISINGGARWGSDDRLTGCAYVHLQIKRSGNDDDSESPLVQGLPSRVTIVGEGAPLYDPRLDDSIGGTASHRADDQDTWGVSYAGSDDYDNPALQLLFFLLGWKINDKLSVGCGVPKARIDMDSFVTAANACDNDITLSIGGTQKKYRSSGVFSDADDRMQVIQHLLTCMNGTLRDENGKLTLDLLQNDLASYVLDFNEGDVLGEFEFDQTGGGLSDNRNIIRGRFVDPSEEALYQLSEYPHVSIDSPDGIERVMSFDLPYVEDGRRAQRLAKQALQRQQFRAKFSGDFTAKALGANVGDIVRLSFDALGFSDKLFRVISKEIRTDGMVPMILLEESALIYQWDAEDSAPVVAVTPTVYDPLNNRITRGDLSVANTVVTFSEVPPFEVQADSEGITTTSLPLTRDIKVFVQGVQQTSGVTVGTLSVTAGLAATASVTSGVVTVSLSTADAVGFVTVPITFNSVQYDRVVVVDRIQAAPNAGGDSGSTSFTDTNWINISTTSYVQVTDTDAIVQSDSSGELRFSASAAYTGDGAAVIKPQYSSDGSSWTDAASEVTGSTATTGSEPLPGFVSLSATTVTGLATSTDFYVRLVAKRSSGSGTLSWTGATFTARQP